MEEQITAIFVVLARLQTTLLDLRLDFQKKEGIENVREGMGVHHNPKTNSVYITLSLITHFKNSINRQGLCLVSEIQVIFYKSTPVLELTLAYSDSEFENQIVFSEEQSFESLDILLQVVDGRVEMLNSFHRNFVTQVLKR
jgi:hypothetical protein